jgi:hypothetical protein
MLSVKTNIYNKKTKGHALMELFKATGKLNFLFLGQLEIFDVCTTADMAHIDTTFKFLPQTHTRVSMGASIFFTAAMIHAFRSARSRGNSGTNARSYTRHEWSCLQAGPLRTKCTLHSNHRLTGVIFQHTKRLLPRSGHFLTTYTHIA